MADIKQQLELDVRMRDNISRSLRNIEKSSDSAFGKKGGSKGLLPSLGATRVALLGVVGAAAAVTGAVLANARNVAKTGDAYAKMATRLGATVEGLSEMRFVAERSGVTYETLTMGMQRMTRRVAEAAVGTGEAVKALKELGIGAEELSQLAPEDQFAAIADEINKVGSDSDKVRLAMKLFDSEGVALVQTMSDGAAGIKDLREQARALGVTFSSEAARKSEAFENSMKNLSASFGAVTKELGLAVIPAITELVDGLTRSVVFAQAFGESFEKNFSKFQRSAADIMEAITVARRQHGAERRRHHHRVSESCLRALQTIRRGGMVKHPIHGRAEFGTLIGEDVVAGINAMIGTSQLARGNVRTRLRSRCFQADNSETAPKTFSEAWEEGSNNVRQSIEKIKAVRVEVRVGSWRRTATQS